MSGRANSCLSFRIIRRVNETVKMESSTIWAVEQIQSIPKDYPTVTIGCPKDEDSIPSVAIVKLCCPLNYLVIFERFGSAFHNSKILSGSIVDSVIVTEPSFVAIVCHRFGGNLCACRHGFMRSRAVHGPCYFEIELREGFFTFRLSPDLALPYPDDSPSGKTQVNIVEIVTCYVHGYLLSPEVNV